MYYGVKFANNCYLIFLHKNQIELMLKNLFSDFATTDKNTWKERIAKDLKGITFEMLQTTNDSGIVVQPFYNNSDFKENSSAIFNHTEWNILSKINVVDEKTANAIALEQLNNGATGLVFQISDTVDLSVLLNEILLQYIETVFELSGDINSFTEKLNYYYQSQNLNLENIQTTIIYNPILNILSHGKDIFSKDLIDSYIAFLEKTKGAFNISIDTSVFCNAGANTVYQLALGIAQLNEYLHILNENNKLDLVQKVHISFAVTTYFFEEIAKLRAFRNLLDLLFKAYNISPEVNVKVSGSTLYKAPLDVYNNFLRDTLAAMAGIAGGCNSLCITHFHPEEDENESFGMRMARNIQLLLKEESFMDKFSDLGAGSFFIEKYTEDIAQQSWLQFQDIEKNGGLLNSFQSIIKEEINQQAQRLILNYKSGKKVLIGVNKYSNPKDDVSVYKNITTKQESVLQPLNLTRIILNE